MDFVAAKVVQGEHNAKFIFGYFGICDHHADMNGRYEASETDEMFPLLRRFGPCAESVLFEPRSCFLAFWKKKTDNPSIFVVFIYHIKQFYYYLCIDINDKLVKEMTDK